MEEWDLQATAPATVGSSNTPYFLPWGLCTSTLTVIYSYLLYACPLILDLSPKVCKTAGKMSLTSPLPTRSDPEPGHRGSARCPGRGSHRLHHTNPHHTPPVWPHHTISADLDDYYINVSLPPWTQSSVGISNVCLAPLCPWQSHQTAVKCIDELGHIMCQVFKMARI